MAQFGYLQAAAAGFNCLFRRKVSIGRNLIGKRMLLNLLSINFR